MKHSKKRSNKMQVVTLWDWNAAVKAVPYLRSVIGSLREHWLDVLNSKRRLELAQRNPTPKGREQIIIRQKQEDELERAETKFNDALAELNTVDAFLVEPVSGVAFLPFRHGDELAWYVYDQFAENGLSGWRLHQDPLEERRPISALEGAAAGGCAS